MTTTNEITPESLRTLGVEVGRLFKNSDGITFSVTSDFRLVLESYSAGFVICKLTTLSQARALLVGLGVVNETK